MWWVIVALGRTGWWEWKGDCAFTLCPFFSFWESCQLHLSPLPYSCLENPRDRGAWQATIHGVAKIWTWLSNWASLRACTPIAFITCPLKAVVLKVPPPLVILMSLRTVVCTHTSTYTHHLFLVWPVWCPLVSEAFRLQRCSASQQRSDSALGSPRPSPLR